MLPQFYVDDLIKTAIKEDINYIDLSTDLLFSDEDTSEAYFISKDEGVLCGINEAMRVFELLDPSFDCCIMKHDGDKIKKEISSVNSKARPDIFLTENALRSISSSTAAV